MSYAVIFKEFHGFTIICMNFQIFTKNSKDFKDYDGRKRHEDI